MKKIIIVSILMCMLGISVNAKENVPRYKIVSSSYEQKDIKEMYEIKNRLIEDYAKWVKSVDDYHQVLADHTYVYNATYHNGVYIIVLGNGKGKTLKGELKVSYCESTKQIKKKSLLFELFHN